MSTMPLWRDDPPATVTERQYAEWKAARHGITLPSVEAIARMRAEEGIVPAAGSRQQAAGSDAPITSAICLAVLVIGTIVTGFAVISAVIGLARYVGG
jgi:multisubunit Na+/H+ antiporter MnhC subunit